MVFAIALTLLPVGESSAAKKKRRRPFRVGAHYVTSESSPRHVRRNSYGQRRYDVYEHHAVEFDVYKRIRKARERAVELRLYMPNGDLYQALPLVPNENPTGPKKRRPIATARLPIAGTLIARYRLFGWWRVDICWEDGADMTCRRGMNIYIDR